MGHSGIVKVRETLKALERIYLEEGARSLLNFDKEVRGRVKKALESKVEAKIVKCNVEGRTVWFYLGPKSTHYIIPRTYCSCKDYNLNVVHKSVNSPCYHLILQVLVEAENSFLEVELDREVFREVLEEVEELEESEKLKRIVKCQIKSQG